jgi:CubicO group peptidase (beta-lactamase class C family)
MSDRGNRTGLVPDRLRHLKTVIEDDIERGLYYGGVILVARRGVIGLHQAMGYTNSKDRRPLTKKSVFSLFSTTKAITNVLVYRAIERGEFALTTKVSEIIPEFSGGQRQHITFYHLLTHSSGLASVFTPVPGMYIDKLDETIAAICANVQSIEEPGKVVTYAPMAAHALMGEAVRRTDPKKRSYRRLVEDEILKPLKMKDTSVGVRKDLRARHVVPIFLDRAPIDHLGHSNLGPNGAFEEENAEMPWVGCISTVPDMFRFAEMLRRGGELDGARIISPGILDAATRNWTGDKPNELYKQLVAARGWEPYPAYLGLGFGLRGEAICHSLFGTLASPRTFGNYGAGSSLFWIDPERQMTFVCLTAGVMNGVDNIDRFQRLSDIAISAAT